MYNFNTFLYIILYIELFFYREMFKQTISMYVYKIQKCSNQMVLYLNVCIQN